MSDEEIWNYAKEHSLVIITKDADFSLKVLYKGTPPKVIHLKFGNLRMNMFHEVLTRNWSNIEQSIQEFNLINVYSDRMECVK